MLTAARWSSVHTRLGISTWSSFINRNCSAVKVQQRYPRARPEHPNPQLPGAPFLFVLPRVRAVTWAARNRLALGFTLSQLGPARRGLGLCFSGTSFAVHAHCVRKGLRDWYLVAVSWLHLLHNSYVIGWRLLVLFLSQDLTVVYGAAKTEQSRLSLVHEGLKPGLMSCKPQNRRKLVHPLLPNLIKWRAALRSAALAHAPKAFHCHVLSQGWVLEAGFRGEF